MLDITNLTVSLAGRRILTRLSLRIDAGDIVVIMGPNGAGKSTLAKAIMGLVDYSGDITSEEGDGTRLNSLSPDARAKMGIFLSFQDPPAIPGVTISDFLRAVTPEEISLSDFYANLQKNLELVGLPEDYSDRELGVGFSGGEKKKLEMLQLLMLDPKLAIFDEIDSGLDVDAVRVIAKAFKKWYSPEKSAIIITHNSRLIKRLKPNKVVIMKRGRITETGGFELAEKVLEDGFDG